MPKRLELLSELVPRTTVIALLVNPNNAQTEGVINELLTQPKLRLRAGT